MSIIDNSNLIIKITEEDIKDAVISTENIKEDLKERGFANVLGAHLGLKFLQTLDINASNKNSLYTITSVLNDIDISDINVNNIKIDVRICQDERHLCVPASHFEFGLTPDIYIFFILSKDMDFAAFVGTTAPGEVKKNKNIDGYYLVSKKDLYSAKSLKNVLSKFKPENDVTVEKNDLEKAQSLIVQFIDDDILHTEKKFLYEQLSKSIELRSYFKEFDKFEFISKNIANRDDMLSGTVLDVFDKISDKTENEFVEAFQDDNDLNDNNNKNDDDIFIDNPFESDDLQEDTTFNNKNSEGLSSLPDDETLANFSSYNPDNDIENENSDEDDDFKLEDVGFAGFEGLKASNNIPDSSLDRNIIDLDSHISFNENIDNDFDREQNNNVHTIDDIEFANFSHTEKRKENLKKEKDNSATKQINIQSFEEMDNILAEANKNSNETDNISKTNTANKEDIFAEISHSNEIINDIKPVEKINLAGHPDVVNNNDAMEELIYDDSYEKEEKNVEYLKEINKIESMEEPSSSSEFEEVNDSETMEELTSDNNFEDLSSNEKVEELTPDNNFEDLSSNEKVEELSTDNNIEDLSSSETVEELTPDNNFEDLSSSETVEELTPDNNFEDLSSNENIEELTPDNNFEDLSSGGTIEELTADNSLEDLSSSETVEELTLDNNFEEAESDTVEIPNIDDKIQEDIREELPNTDSDEEITNEDFQKLDELSGTIDNVLAPLDGNLDSLEPVDNDFKMNSTDSNEQNYSEVAVNNEEQVLSNADITDNQPLAAEQYQTSDIESGNLEEIHDANNEFDNTLSSNDAQLQELQPLEDLSSDYNVNNDSSFEEVNLEETNNNSNFETIEELPAENNTYADSFAELNNDSSFEEVNLEETNDNSNFETIEELPAENNTYADSFAEVNNDSSFEEVNLETSDNSNFEAIDNTTIDNAGNNNFESTDSDNIDEFADAFSGFSDMNDESSSSSSNSLDDINLDSLDGDDDDINIDGIDNIDDIDIDNLDIDNISTDDIDLSNINLDDIELDDEDLNGVAIEDFNPSSENVSSNMNEQSPIINEEKYQPNYDENDKNTLEQLYQENTKDKIPGNGDKMDNSLDENNVNQTNITNQGKPKQKSNTALLLLVFVALLGFMGYTKKDLIMEQINNIRGGSSDSVLITEGQNNMPVEGEETNTPPQEPPAPSENQEQQPQQEEQQQQPVGAIPGEAGGPQDAKSMEESLKRAQKPQSIDKIAQPTTKLSEPLSSAQISKLYWEVPKDLTYNENVTKYLQVVGKTSKLAIQSDLLNVKEMPYSSKMIVSVKLSRTGEVIDAIATVSSGSKQVDAIVLQSVKSAMKYVKAPTSEFTKESYDFSLIINF